MMTTAAAVMDYAQSCARAGATMGDDVAARWRMGDGDSARRCWMRRQGIRLSQIGTSHQIAGGNGRRVIGFVHGDVKTRLLKFFFDIQLARILQLAQVGAHPANLLPGHSLFSDIDGLASQVGRGSISAHRRGIAVDALQMPLKCNGAYSGVDLNRSMKQGCVLAGEIG